MALLQTIRATASLQHLPVLMITAQTEPDNIIAATKAGADGYIVKPSLNTVTFKKMLSDILMKRSLARRERHSCIKLREKLLSWQGR